MTIVLPTVLYRFFAFNLHDSRALWTLVGIFLRGLLGLAMIAGVLGLLIVTGLWLFTNLNERPWKRLARSAKRPSATQRS